MKFSELITNNDGRLSTTTTVQFCGFVILAMVLVWATAIGSDYVSELYDSFAIYCGGLTVSKGAVHAYQSRNQGNTYD